jgi:hypothetical protein
MGSDWIVTSLLPVHTPTYCGFNDLGVFCQKVDQHTLVVCLSAEGLPRTMGEYVVCA